MTVWLIALLLAQGYDFAGPAWKRSGKVLEGKSDLVLKFAVGPGDFSVRARLRIVGQKKSAASFFLDGNHFGFEGAKETMFVSGPLFGGLRLFGRPPPRDKWLDFEAVRTAGEIRFVVNGQTMATLEHKGPFWHVGLRPSRATMQLESVFTRGTRRKLPFVDLPGERVVVDREPGQYLGHPTTVLLNDKKTILCVYPKGHGRGAIVMKLSTDGGRTWSERLPVPDNWATSKEVPTLHKMGRKRLILFSGLHPVRMAVSEDEGLTWTPLRPVGDWGGIVTMASVVPLKKPGRFLAMFHDDGRFFKKGGKRVPAMTLYQTFSNDRGLTWSFPEAIHSDDKVHLCEPGVIRSPDGKRLAALLRENRRVKNSHVIFSDDEARTWSEPRELPATLTGDRHTGRYAPDGRLFITFRDTAAGSPTKGDWCAWVGTFEDIEKGRDGQYRIRLMDNHHRWDCAYPGLELLPDGTFVTTTYGHWTKGEKPYIVSVRLKLAELDARAK